MNRLFISYRSSDGKKDAARLAVDLDRLYGDDQVYFDKHDLRGGVSWRAAIAGVIGEKPVVLLLITPALFGATDAQGRRCIERDDDPIRNELIEARKRGAVLLPLLAEGMSMPEASMLPDELRFVAEAHALRLRTDDWEHDLARLVRDLKAHGIVPLGPVPPPPPPSPSPPLRKRRWVQWALAGWLGSALLFFIYEEAGLGEDIDEPSVLGPQPSPPPGLHAGLQEPAQRPRPSPLAASAALQGTWWLIDPHGLRMRATLTFQGDSAQLVSDATPIGGNPGWLSYAHFTQQQTATPMIRDIVYRAEGSLTSQGLEMGVAVYSGDGRGPLASGNWSLAASPDGRELGGAYRAIGSPMPMTVRLVRP